VLVDNLGVSVAREAEMYCVSDGTVNSGAARGRARQLPRLVLLHLVGPEQGSGNRPPAGRVLPA
jgi:hypothetical protein